MIKVMLTLHRWTRCAKDRLYATDDEGRILGWLDLLTGDLEIEVDDDRSDEIRALIDAWFRDHARTLPDRSVLCGAATPSEPRPKRELRVNTALLTG